jgi:autotransporter adhesin
MGMRKFDKNAEGFATSGFAAGRLPKARRARPTGSVRPRGGMAPLALFAGASALAIAGGWATPAYADTYPSTETNCTSNSAQTVGRLPNVIPSGQPVNGSGVLSTVTGCGASGNGQLAATVYGSNSSVSGRGGTAIGFYSAATANFATALGLETRATAIGATALGFGAQASAIGAIAIGGAAGNGVTPLSVANSTLATGDYSIAIGSNATRGAQAAGDGSIALGGEATANGDGSIALGSEATANGDDDVAIGTGSTANGNGNGSAVAIGAGNSATGAGAVAIGDPTTATGDGAFAGGLNSTATGDGTIAIGNFANAGAGDQGVGIPGTPAKGAVSIGNLTTAANQGAVAIGNQTSADGRGAIAIGNLSEATGLGSIALGDSARANAGDTIVIGSDSVASDTWAIAIGHTVQATAQQAVSIGVNSIASGLAATAYGSFAEARGVAAVALGSGSTAAGDFSIALGLDAVAQDLLSIAALGSAYNAGSIAIGAGAVAGVDGGPNESDLAVGDGAEATGSRAIALGRLGRAEGEASIAAGYQAAATGANAIAIGTGASVSGDDSGALGRANAVSGNGSFAVGNANLVAQDNSFVLGNYVTATQANSVVLGNGSTDRAATSETGVTLGGVNYSFAGVGSAANGVVSVGAAGAERQLINVAAGRIAADSTDAVNGSQLFATNQAVVQNAADIASLDTRVTNAEGDIVNLDNRVTTAEADIVNLDNRVTTAEGNIANLTTATGANSAAIAALQQDALQWNPVLNAYDASHGTASPQVITNVAPGALTATSTDAVNGSQLYATNQQVAQNTADIASLDTRVTNVEGDVADIGARVDDIAGDTSTSYVNANGRGVRYVRTNETGLPPSDAFANAAGSSALGYNATAGAADSLALGRDSSATVEGSVAIGAGSVADRAIAPGSGTLPAGSGVIPYNTADQTLLGAVSVGSAGAYRQITNVADGTDPHDAATIRQLQGLAGSLSVSSTLYFHANSTGGDSLAIGEDSVAVGPDTIVNGDNGIGIGIGAIVDTTAPGGTAIGQNARVAQADGIALGTSAQASSIQSIAIGAGANASFANSLALGGNSVTVVGALPSYTGYGLATPQSSVGEVSVGAPGAERQITNVAAGSAPTDAVNVAQLNQVAQNTAAALGGGAAYDPATGAYTPPSYSVGGSTYNNVGDAITNVDARVTQNRADIDALAQQLADGSIGLVRQEGGSPGNGDITIGAATGGTRVSIAGTDGDRILSGLVDGVADNDAVTVRQLAAAITNASLGSVTYDDASRTSVTFNPGGAPTTLRNVAPGQVAAGSTDAVNGGQLYETNVQLAAVINGEAGPFRANNSSGYGAPQATGADAVAGGFGAVASGARSTAIGANASATGQNSVALGFGSTDGGRDNVVSVGAPGAERQIVNVAAGTRPTDAVNLAQLSAGLDTTLGQAARYTDLRIAELSFDLNRFRRDADAGTAAAIAAAGLPQAYVPGAGMIAGAFGVWRGEAAFAFGLSTASREGNLVFRGGATVATRSSTFGVNIGFGYQF